MKPVVHHLYILVVLLIMFYLHPQTCFAQFAETATVELEGQYKNCNSNQTTELTSILYLVFPNVQPKSQDFFLDRDLFYSYLDSTLAKPDYDSLGKQPIQISVSPNPIIDNFKLIAEISEEMKVVTLDLAIYSVTGTIVFNKQIAFNEKIDISNLTPGIYFIQASIPGYPLQVVKVLKV